MDDCRRSIAQFLARDLKDWSGLAVGCRDDDVLSWARPLDLTSTARLGSADEEYDVRAVEAEGFNEPVLLHFRAGRLELLRTEYWSFHAFECAVLLEQLGPPTERADLVWRGQVHPEADWVYADRGLALGVIAQTGLIVTVAAFPAGEPMAYLEHFAKLRPGREYPAPSGC